MVRAFAGDSTITSRLRPSLAEPPALAPFAANPVLAATLFTLTSRGRPGGYRRQSAGGPRTGHSAAATTSSRHYGRDWPQPAGRRCVHVPLLQLAAAS